MAAQFLYAWCRYVDDEIDEESDERASQGMSRFQRFESLLEKTEAAVRGQPNEHSAFEALSYVVQSFRVPEKYPLDLMTGMQMDLLSTRYSSMRDLERYCYCVAGTVGLMMSHVMGVSDPAALTHALDLGIAFQLTNISRDVATDAKMGRIYLPLDELQKVGVSPVSENLMQRPEAVAEVVKKLLDRAEVHYNSGREGLKYLSLRTAFVIASALEIYRAIGIEVRRRGPRAWETRVIVPFSLKCKLLIKSAWCVLPLIPKRILMKWKPMSDLPVWRYL